jgi:hypothetical protein
LLVTFLVTSWSLCVMNLVLPLFIDLTLSEPSTSGHHVLCPSTLGIRKKATNALLPALLSLLNAAAEEMCKDELQADCAVLESLRSVTYQPILISARRLSARDLSNSCSRPLSPCASPLKQSCSYHQILSFWSSSGGVAR